MLFPLQATAQWFGDVSVEWQNTDNLPRAQFKPDQLSDHSLSVALNGGFHIQTGDYTGLNITGLLRSSTFNEFTGMSNIETGIGASLSHKFGLGLLAPTLTVSGQYSRNEFRNSIRDSDNLAFSVSLQKRLTERTSLAAGIGYDLRDGDHDLRKTATALIPGNAFDSRAISGFLQSEFDLNEVSWLSASAELSNGDIVSTGLPYALITAATKALTADHVFGPKATAYRIDARTTLLSIDYNHVVGERGTWYLGVENQDTRGSADIDYTVQLIRTGFIYGF